MSDETQNIIFQYFAKDYTDKVSKEKDLKDYLYDYPVSELKKMSITNKLKKKVKKDQLVQHYIENVVEELSYILSFFSEQNIKELNYIIKQGEYLEIKVKGNCLLSIKMLNNLRLFKIGFVNYDKKTDILKIHIPKTTVNILKNIFVSKDITTERREINKIFKHIMSLIEAYGIIEERKLHDLYEEVYGYIDYLEFQTIIFMKSLTENLEHIFIEETRYWGIVSSEDAIAMINDSEYIESDYYMYSKSDLLKLHNDNYLNDYHSYKKLKKFIFDSWDIKKSEYEGFFIQFVMEYISLYQTNEVQARSNLLKQINDYLPAPADVISELIALIDDIKYDYPCWKLKGNKLKRTKKTQVKSDKINRNDKCPCSSGKKYKHCCGK